MGIAEWWTEANRTSAPRHRLDKIKNFVFDAATRTRLVSSFDMRVTADGASTQGFARAA
jgi:hypothetical protein